MSDGKAAKNDTALIEGWSKQYGHPVTLAELQEINCNLSHFFALMLSWEKQFKCKEEKNEADNQ